MSSKRDLKKNDSTLQSSGYVLTEHQSQQTTQGTGFPGVNEGRRTMNYTATNQPRTEDLKFDVKTDPELAIITTQLEESASYAINPDFKEKLRKDLLNQFIAYNHTNDLKRKNPLYRVYRPFLRLLRWCFHR